MSQNSSHDSLPNNANKARTIIEPTTKQLCDLPPEILRCIADHLEPSSASCLSLCNRSLASVLGLNSRSSLQRADHEDRFAFALALARDLPGEFACHTCARLHRSLLVKWPCSLAAQQSITCVSNARAYILERSSLYLIKFVHIHLALTSEIPLDAFTHTEFRATSVLSVDARIESDELLIRSQRWVLLPRARRNEFVTGGHHKSLCQHVIIRGSVDGDDPLTQLVQAQLEGFESQVMSCTKCHLDFSVDIIDIGEKDTAMVVTRWSNFGKGLTPSHRDWQCHFPQPYSYTLGHNTAAVGTIMERFEARPGLSCDELSKENVCKLLSGPGLGQRSMNVDGPLDLVWRSKYAGASWWYLSPHAAEKAQNADLMSSFTNFLSPILSFLSSFSGGLWWRRS